jgi:Protein of unknown function (DUF3450)
MIRISMPQRWRALVWLTCTAPFTCMAAEPLAAAIEAQTKADQAAAASQQRIDKLQDETLTVAAKYQQALADLDSIKKYNAQLDLQVASQDAEVASLEKQLSELQVTEREVQPLMQRMVDTIAQFVSLDLPFLLEERTRRVESLKEMMGRADVTISEKYRRILEAYQIELEYGRTLEAYEGRMGEADQTRTVEFVRLGRVSLMYQTLDRAETGYWDATKRAWVRDDSYAGAVKDALLVAKKVGAPDLLRVPVPAPVEIKS